mgnify:CR=1 FL=1
MYALLTVPFLKATLTEDFVFYYETHADRLGLIGSLRRIIYEHDLKLQDSLIEQLFDQPAPASHGSQPTLGRTGSDPRKAGAALQAGQGAARGAQRAAAVHKTGAAGLGRGGPGAKKGPWQHAQALAYATIHAPMPGQST